MKIYGKAGEVVTFESEVKLYAGSVALSVGQEGGSVALALSFVPKLVKVSVRKPAGGLGLGANVTGTPTISGFDFELLNGTPDVGGYYLDYEVTG